MTTLASGTIETKERRLEITRLWSTAGFLVTAAALLTACGAGGVSSSLPPPPSAHASPSPAVASAPPPPSPSPSTVGAAVTPIPGCLPACVEGGLVQPGELPAGEYTTKHFFGGQFTVTLEEGWSSFEDSTGEFALARADLEGAAILFWLDVYPAIDPTNQPVPGIERSADSTLSWLEANPNVDVSPRREATLGGLPAQAVEIERSAAATNVDPGCPSEGRPCVGLFGFPQWEFSYSQGGPFHLRLIAADAAWGGEPHVIYAMTEGADAELYAQIEAEAEEIIESARLPLGVERAP
jgi:hypothetical protein